MDEDRAKYQNDHDLLITLHEQVKGVRGDIRELGSNLVPRIIDLEKGKVDHKDFDMVKSDFEHRLKWLERIAYGGIGILGFIEMYFRLFNTQ